MIRRRSLALLLVPATLLLAMPGRAAAQDRTIDVAAGYAYSRITNEGGFNIPAGWFASVGAGIGDALSIVGEVNGAYRSRSESVFGATIDAKVSLHSFLAGPRVRSGRGRTRGFGQLLVGAHVASASFSGSFAGVTESESDSETNLAVAPGGGVDIALSGNSGVRLGVNYRLVRSDEDWGKVFQAVVGFFWSNK